MLTAILCETGEIVRELEISTSTHVGARNAFTLGQLDRVRGGSAGGVQRLQVSVNMAGSAPSSRWIPGLESQQGTAALLAAVLAGASGTLKSLRLDTDAETVGSVVARHSLENLDHLNLKLVPMDLEELLMVVAWYLGSEGKTLLLGYVPLTRATWEEAATLLRSALNPGRVGYYELRRCSRHLVVMLEASTKET
jgi:hypothetical protein